MDQLTAHQRAQEVFASVLDNLKPDRLQDPTPCTEWNAGAVVDHVIAGNTRVAGMDPKESPTSPDLVTAHAVSAKAAHDAFAAPDGLTRTFEVPFGVVPGSVVISLRTTDVLTHAWDLAKATRQATDLDSELAAEMLQVSRELIRPSFRGPGRAFDEEQPCPSDRPIADQLAAFLGRRMD